ncbi:MAG: matrixin family metalloprotease [Sandaracinaceae bacterium]|nr:matrixin family metalloprotease [Sandaracinaceae bacterium]
MNGVYVLDRWPFPDRRLAVTVSSYVASTGELIDTDILVNGEMQLAVLDGERHAGDRYDLVLVLTHELGHALGLDESDVSGATMFHRIRPGETQRRELSVDDVDGALALYGMRSPALAGGCHVARSRGRAPAALILLGAAVALCRRSRRGGPRAHA